MTRIFATVLMIGISASLPAAPQPSFAQQKPKSSINCASYCLNYCEKNATPGGLGRTNCSISCQHQCEMVKAGMK